MTKHIKRAALACAALWLVSFNAQAQSDGAHAAHGAQPAGQTATSPTNNQGSMDHSDMQMQEGAAPADARDPDAYSGGFKRNEGQYALDPRYRLRMSDEHIFASLRMDKLEYVRAKGKEWGAYEGQAWIGSTFNRLVLKGEGEFANGKMQESRTEVLWGHAVRPFWDAQFGARFDYGRGEPSRQWLAFGVQGLAPYWFEIDTTAYVGSGGRTALRFSAEYDVLLTQKLYLQPSMEVNFYGKDDPERDIGRGLSDGKIGVRLKYEINRQLVPYIGVEWSSKFGKTADIARDEGSARQETRFVAGVSFWF
ncbi:MAG: copper resistance protein CopB [Pusillimonas sp.]|nr:copper resistance protein CopB [Pusillimonas sp.]MBC42413.1 copper resistance protein CopB [Pusillimonas sp.]HCP78355.1 copper resistance protein CopB [Pusillimonas sp.]